MLEPANGEREICRSFKSKIDAAVGNNEVPTLCKCRYHTRNCRETLRVKN